ncbi:hypothetical protein [Cardiobacterium hominis]|uniref:hypothetical protein n=1 Tax=Cardiobacterium hominis TaxID=2718 RepID=UPI0028E37F28|nr:hypothetical protein [Cardiobacterium hominis]
MNWLKKWLKPSAPANSDAMNWAEQWLNRSQWFKDKYLKERYLVAEAVLHALSDPSPRVDLPLPYADMDEFIRALLDLGKIAGKNLFHPQQPNATPIWRTWLNLSHPDGRIREQTLHTLPARIPGTLYAILVLLRLNDWAAPVRAAARHRLADFAAATNPQHLAAALTHTLRHWTNWGRMQKAERQNALAVLLNDNVVTELVTILARSPAGPMIGLLSQLGQIAAIDPHLPYLAAQAIQPALRAKAYQSLLSGKTTWVAGKEQEWIERRHNLYRWRTHLDSRPLTITVEHDPTLQQAAADRSPIVRRVAADAIIAALPHLGPSEQHLATRLAVDPNPSVAERGAYILHHSNPAR